MDITNPMYYIIPHGVKALKFSITKDAALGQWVQIVVFAIHENNECPVASFDMFADPIPCEPIAYSLPITQEHKNFKLFLNGRYSKGNYWLNHPRVNVVGGEIDKYVMFGYDDDWDHFDYNDIVLTVEYTK
ncbi:MAG: hypothetical protein HY795_15735 [Desulfovibrio sp.]|nr:hypothetical protein [Desulfovibrio sp.]MBI4958727.1 hypothetical protein [Desulfovibrio sp.]